MRTVIRSRAILIPAAASAAWLLFAAQVSALTDTTIAQTEASEAGSAGQDIAPAGEAPLRQAFEGAPPTTEAQADTPPAAAEGAEATEASEPASAEIIRDLTTLPEPVRSMRERIVEAAASGDIERLRPLFEGTPKPPQIMNADSDDPIDSLKNFAGDAEGQEILAIMLDILSTGAARVEPGTPEEAYVWPYFAGKPLASLTPPERVDLLRIVTAGDLMGMEETGNYNFYRLGISPDGQWKFFGGGD